MSKNNSKSLASLRQKLRKYNKEFEEDISRFRENPDAGDEEEEQPKGLLFYFKNPLNKRTMPCNLNTSLLSNAPLSLFILSYPVF